MVPILINVAFRGAALMRYSSSNISASLFCFEIRGAYS